jgi:hypothetical protein
MIFSAWPSDWKPTDKALDLHAHLHPKCEYLKSIGYSFDNKPKIDDKYLVVIQLQLALVAIF